MERMLNYFRSIQRLFWIRSYRRGNEFDEVVRLKYPEPIVGQYNSGRLKEISNLQFDLGTSFSVTSRLKELSKPSFDFGTSFSIMLSDKTLTVQGINQQLAKEMKEVQDIEIKAEDKSRIDLAIDKVADVDAVTHSLEIRDESSLIFTIKLANKQTVYIK